ncbi:MAG: VCBS repeat-containing protein [Deltaproteobacteria bacterium]|nr:VCBS repeat-containing protein [Deltaproteobacteria bacterium]
MRPIPGRRVGRAVIGAALVLSCVLGSAASAAGYPRRIAIAPFSVLTKEDIGATVSVLPRLLSSRLMALAGADVLVVPPGKPPEETAKEAKYPLLLQGTVSKLGKGYSVDATVTDLSTGGSAGAFFAAAASEDEIIQQLGVLSGEIAEKLFGVQGAIRATAPPPPAYVQAAPGVQSIGGAPSAAVPMAAPPPAAPAPQTLSEGWVPSSLKKTGQSDKISDELYGVVAGDQDEEGNGEVVTWGRSSIYVYTVKGKEIVPFTRIVRGREHHFLNVESVDLDGDGKKDLVVTDLQGDRLVSFLMMRKGAGFVEQPGVIPYHLAVLRGWNGKDVVAGQRHGLNEPFQGKIHAMKWDGRMLSEGEKLPLDTNILPLSTGGVYSLAPVRTGNEWAWLYVDSDEHLRILDSKGKSAYRSKDKFGAVADGFEYAEVSRLEGRRPLFPLRRAPRVVAGGRGDSFVAVTEIRKGVLQTAVGTIESSRIVILQMEGSGFAERAASPRSDFFYSGVELLPAGGIRRGSRAIASVIEQPGSAFSDRVSRLHMFQVE